MIKSVQNGVVGFGNVALMLPAIVFGAMTLSRIGVVAIRAIKYLPCLAIDYFNGKDWCDKKLAEIGKIVLPEVAQKGLSINATSQQILLEAVKLSVYTSIYLTAVMYLVGKPSSFYNIAARFIGPLRLSDKTPLEAMQKSFTQVKAYF